MVERAVKEFGRLDSTFFNAGMDGEEVPLHKQVIDQAKVLVNNSKNKFASAHDLRRSYGERWATRVMPQVLMELMRHESIETTLKFYVGRDAQRTARLVREAYNQVQPRPTTAETDLRGTLRGTDSQTDNPPEGGKSYVVSNQQRRTVTRSGLEPETYGLKVRCSTN